VANLSVFGFDPRNSIPDVLPPGSHQHGDPPCRR
jgi:hypothetical protein